MGRPWQSNRVGCHEFLRWSASVQRHFGLVTWCVHAGTFHTIIQNISSSRYLISKQTIMRWQGLQKWRECSKESESTGSSRWEQLKPLSGVDISCCVTRSTCPVSSQWDTHNLHRIHLASPRQHHHNRLWYPCPSTVVYTVELAHKGTLFLYI